MGDIDRAEVAAAFRMAQQRLRLESSAAEIMARHSLSLDAVLRIIHVAAEDRPADLAAAVEDLAAQMVGEERGLEALACRVDACVTPTRLTPAVAALSAVVQGSVLSSETP